jgi:hypothetical protein
MRPVPGYLISLRTRAGDRRKSDGVSVPAADPRWWSARCLGPVRGRGAGGETALPAHQTPLRPAHSRLARHRADRRRIRPCALSSDCCSSLPAQARLVTCAVLRRCRLDDQRWSGPRSPCRGRGLGRPISKSSDLLLGHIDADVLGCSVGVAGKGCDATGGEDAIKITTCCFGHLLVVFRPSVSVVGRDSPSPQFRGGPQFAARALASPRATPCRLVFPV